MKENEFLDGVGNLECDVVERFISMDNKLHKKMSRAKTKKIWLRFGAIAACFALIVCAVVVLPTLNGTNPGDILGVIPFPETNTTEKQEGIDPPSHTPIIFDATVSPEKLSGNSLEFVVGSSSVIEGGGDACPPKFEFRTEIVVKARVVNNHPDVFYSLDTSSVYRPVAYRLIQMETIEVINGENVPKYFLYLMNDYVYVDMSVYDSLLISMRQVGVENYVLKNVTQNQMESFDLPIFTDVQNSPELGSVIAFTDGVFDESLWQNDNWLFGYQFAKYYLDNPEKSDLVVARGDSESTVIDAIRKQIKEWYPDDYQEPFVVTLDFKTQEAKDALDFVSPFKNGVFSQTLNLHGKEIWFRRYINGCQTEEIVSIDLVTEEVTYSEVRYTEEDMASIENISAHLSKKAVEYALQIPTPPHTDPEGKELLCLNLYAWYVKIDGKMYGVIKTAWRYQEKDNWFIQYYDDAYILYDMSEGTATDIPRDDLVRIVGKRNVYMGEYGQGIEIPM